MLPLSRWTCSVICWNSNEAHVFCSLLSFQLTFADVCISNRSQVATGFVKTVVPTSRTRGERRSKQKMEGVFNVRKHGKCKRKSICFVCAIIKYTAGEYVEIMCFLTKYTVSCKQENGCFGGTILHCKILCEIKKNESETHHSVEGGFPNFGCFHC